MAEIKINLDDANKQHAKRIDGYIAQVAALYRITIDEAVGLAESVKVNSGNIFSFGKNPKIKGKAKKLFDKFAAALMVIINSGTEREWTQAASDADAIIKEIMKTVSIPKKMLEGYGQRNLQGLLAFQQRKTRGMNLSDRVWNLTDQFKSEIEMAMDIGIGEGISAMQLSRNVRKYLNEPDRLFRRVRDKWGNLVLSQSARGYHPGQGVYRSSFKNAKRMTATETNTAYRASDFDRWNSLDFVVGIEIKLSNNHTLNGKPFFDICDKLQGKYPKGFEFTGWHPQCRCHAIPILLTREELNKTNEIFARGGDISNFQSKNKISDVPPQFKKWINDNADKIATQEERGTVPWFLRDNKQYWQ